MFRSHVWMFVLVASLSVMGCSSDSGSTGGFDVGAGDSGADADVGITDSGDDTTGDAGSDDAGDAGDDTIDDAASDTAEDVAEDASGDASDDAGGDAASDASADADASSPGCEDVDCGPYGTCEAGDDGPFCVCDAGFEDLGAGCQDIDECAGDEPVCGERETCINQPGDYLCTCAEGYTASGDACVDVDECASGAMCEEGFTCRNLSGSMRCDCASPNLVDGDACRPLRVLHVHDHLTPEGPIFEALERRGADVEDVYVSDRPDGVSVVEALEGAEAGTDLAIVNLPGSPLVDEGTDDALVAWLESGRRLIVYSYQLDALTGVLARVSVRPTGFTDPRAVVSAEAEGYDLFAQRGGVSSIASEWPDDFSINGFELLPIVPARVLVAANYGRGDDGVALVVSTALDLAVFGFSPSEAGGFAVEDRVDADGDGVGDVAELTMALIDLMYEPPMLVVADHARPTITTAAGAVGLPWIAVETRGEVVDAVDRWDPALLAVSREADIVPDTDADLIDDWHRTERPLLYNAWDLDALDTVQSALGVGVARSWEVDASIEELSLGVPFDGLWFWHFDAFVEGVALDDLYQDSGDVLIPGDDDVVLATFVVPRSRLEQPAAVWSPADATIVNGLNLSEHRASDLDTDDTPDIVEFAINQLRFLIAR